MGTGPGGGGGVATKEREGEKRLVAGVYKSMQRRAALRYLLLLGARGSASGERHFSQRSTAPPSLL
jgi:hypothetical protein